MQFPKTLIHALYLVGNLCSLNPCLLLTPRQKAFVAEYIIDKNASAAAVRAGYSPAGAASSSYHLMNNPEVRHLIDLTLGLLAERAMCTAETVIAEISKVAFASVQHFYDAGGNLLNVADIDPDVAATIASIETEHIGGDEGMVTVKKVKLLDKVKALDMLAKHFNLYEADNKSKAVNVKIGYGKEDE